MSEYGKQIKAFFHFLFKHFFEFEFGIRVAVEILIFVWFVCLLSVVLCRISYKVFGRLKRRFEFINQEIVLPLRVRLFEKLAFSTNNLNWQERANKIKEDVKKAEDKAKNNNRNKKAVKKSYTSYCILIYIFLVVWILGFH